MLFSGLSSWNRCVAPLERTLPPDPSEESIWLTDRSSHTTAALRDRDAIFVRYVRERNLGDVARCIPHAHRLLADRGIDRAISTGSGIAIGYLPYLAARGVECHYIESAARVAGPSRTGRLLRHVPGVHTHTQQTDWADRHWAFVGSVVSHAILPVASLALQATPKS